MTELDRVRGFARPLAGAAHDYDELLSFIDNAQLVLLGDLRASRDRSTLLNDPGSSVLLASFIGPKRSG